MNIKAVVGTLVTTEKVRTREDEAASKGTQSRTSAHPLFLSIYFEIRPKKKKKKRHFKLRHPRLKNNKTDVLKERMCIGTSGKDKDRVGVLARCTVWSVSNSSALRGTAHADKRDVLKSPGQGQGHDSRGASTVRGCRHFRSREDPSPCT